MYTLNHSIYNDYYYSVDMCLDIVKYLSAFQFGDHCNTIHELIIVIYNLLNRTNEKNCLEIVGEPNSFKSTFTCIIASAMINTGWCNKNNKLSQFGLQECANKTLIMMDDPNFDVRPLEQFMTIFSGDPTNIQVRHKQDFTIYKMLVILCANIEMFRVKFGMLEWKDIDGKNGILF